MSSDFHAYIPYVNRPDLLERAVNSVSDLYHDLTIVDNSSVENELSEIFLHGYGAKDVSIFRPTVPLTFTQSQNWFFADAKRKGCKFILWLHSDCQIPLGAAPQLIERVRGYYEESRKWGVAFTFYDIFSAVNLEMVDEVGGYDTNIRAYKSDQDFYRRVQLARWELINTEIEVEAIKAGHLGSQTIRSDEKLALINGIIQTADSFYYQEKWGGDAGHERFDVKFNRPDLFGGK